MSAMTASPAPSAPPGLPDPQALVEEFAAGYRFELDDFQVRGCLALAGRQGALVAAPTGAGKTVVGSSPSGWPCARAARPSTPPR